MLQIRHSEQCELCLVIPTFQTKTKGPSKNYVTARGGKGSTILLHIVGCILMWRGYFMKQLRNSRYAILELRGRFLVSLMCYAIVNRKFYANVAYNIITIGELPICLYQQQNKNPVVYWRYVIGVMQFLDQPERVTYCFKMKY